MAEGWGGVDAPSYVFQPCQHTAIKRETDSAGNFLCYFCGAPVTLPRTITANAPIPPPKQATGEE